MNKVGSIVVVTWSQLWSQGHSLANKVLPMQARDIMHNI